MKPQKTKFKQTEIGMIPEEWEVRKLKELLYIKGRIGWKGLKKSEFGDKGVIIINGPDIQNGKVNWLQCSRVPRWRYEESKEIMVKEKDILMTKDGTIGKLAFIIDLPEPATLASGIFLIRSKSEKLDQEFLYQFFNSKFFKNIVESRIDGSVVPHLYQRDIEELYIPLPPLPEQRAIAKILSDLDSKIKLNQQMNKTLEAIGQALFKHWFVDFEFPNEEGKPYKSSGVEMVYNEELGKEIPKGWRVGRLGDILDNVKKSLKIGNDLKERKYVPIDKMPMKNIGLDSYLPYTEAKSSLIAFEKNDILLGAMRVYFHRVNLAPFAGITRTTTFVLRPKNKEHLAFSLFLLNQDETINYANAHSSGTTMPYAVWDGSLAEMEIIIPDEKIIYKFNKLANPILKRIRDRIFEQITLSAIRDTLLPKLMSGKIRVPVEEFKQSEIGMIPEEWEVKIIPEIAENFDNLRKPLSSQERNRIKGNYPYYGAASIIDYVNDYIFDGCFLLIAEDGTVTTDSVHPMVQLAKGKFWVSNHSHVIKCFEVDDTKFLYYQLKNTNIIPFITGAVQPKLSQRNLNQIPILWPKNKKERQAIAKILSDLDSKIELNQQMNKTLEAIWQALFKHWFVDFEFPNEEGKPYKSSGVEMVYNEELGKEIPKGWRVGRLGEFVDVIKGCSYKTDDLKDSKIALVTLKSINRGGGFNQEGYKEYIGEFREEQVINDGEIIVAQTDLTQKAEVVGRPAIVYSLGRYKKLIASLDLQIVRPKQKFLKNYLYYLLKSEEFHNHALSYTAGTTVLHLNKMAVPEFLAIIPNNQILEKFNLVINGLFDKIKNNLYESLTLSAIRDALLPKLMSGKIRVPVEVMA